MRKLFKRCLALSLVAALLLALACAPAMAASANGKSSRARNDGEEYLPVRLGRWIKCSPKSWDPNYTITVKKDCILQIDWKNAGTTGDTHVFMEFSAGQFFYVQVDSYDGVGKFLPSGTKKFVFTPGTYTFVPYQSEGKASVRLKTAAIVNEKNYRRGLAQTLKKNKTVVIEQTPDNNYGRWYKIKLTRPGKVKLYLNAGINYGYFEYIDLFDSNMKLYEYNRGLEMKQTGLKNSVVFTTTEKLKKGTYYIFVPGNYAGFLGSASPGTYQTLKWN